MPSTKRSCTDSSEKSWPIYYRSKHLAPSIVYVETQRSWRGYNAHGELLGRGSAPIPETILGLVEEIDQAEAHLLLPAGWQGDASAETRELSDSVPETAEQPDVVPMTEQPPGSLADLVSHTTVQFRPRRWRYVARSLTLWLLVILGFWWVLRGTSVGKEWTDYAWDFYVALASAVYLPRVVWKAWKSTSKEAIVITDTEIVIYGAYGGASIALAELDISRSSHRGPFDVLVGRLCLYSVSGNRLCMRRWAYTRADVRTLLARVGVRQQGPA